MSSFEKAIYLDHASTSPMNGEVLEAMTPYFLTEFGNASSGTHRYGWASKAAVKKARKTIAGHIQAEEGEIYFTSGATESISTGIKGIFDRYKKVGNHINIAFKSE